MKGGKVFGMTPGVVAAWSLERMVTSKRFCNCCCKVVLQMIAYELEIKKDTVQKIIVEDLKKSMLMLCTACNDCRT